MAMAFVGVRAQVPVFSESFEDYSIPAGWTTLDADQDGQSWEHCSVKHNITGHTGNGSVVSYSYDNSTYAVLTPDNWLITPAISLSGTSLLSYWFAVSSSYPGDHYGVYISTTTATDTAAFTLLYEMTPTAANGNWTQNTIDLTNYSGNTVYLAFRHFSCTDMFLIALDDITVSTMTTESLLIASPSMLEFDIVEPNTNSEVQTVQVVTNNITTAVSATVSAPFAISADSITFGTTATMPSTGGVLYVQYSPTAAGTHTGSIVITADSLSQSVMVSGQCIDCDNITLPLTQNFESADGLYCWTPMVADNGNSISLSPISSEGSYSLRFSSFSTASDYNQWIITPELPVTTAMKMVRFDYKPHTTTSSTETFRVGYSTTPTLSDFTWESPVTVAGGTDWQTYISTGIPGGAKYIAINYYSDYQYYLYIDNMVIDVAGDCMFPTNLTVSNILAHTATVSWTPAGNAAGNETFYVEYAPQGSDNWLSVNTTASQTDLTNLTPNTTYNVRLYMDCSTSTSDTVTTTFTSGIACGAPSNLHFSNITGSSVNVVWTSYESASGTETYHLEYSDANGNWQSVATTGSQYVLTNLNELTTYNVLIFMDCGTDGYSDILTGTFTTKCLYGGEVAIGEGTSTSNYIPDYCFYNYSYTQQIYLASEMEGANEIQSVSFEVATLSTATTSQHRNLKIYLMHTDSASDTAWLDASNAQLVYSNTDAVIMEGWNTFSFTSPFMYNGTSNIAVIMVDSTGVWSSANSWRCHTTGTGLSRYVYNDNTPYSTASVPAIGNTTTYRNNVIFGVPCDTVISCVKPTGLTVVESTNNSVTLTWTENGTATSWNVEYDVTGYTQGNSSNALIVTNTTTVTIGNLTSGVTYDFYVQADCGDDQSSWTSPVSATLGTYLMASTGSDTLTTCGRVIYDAGGAEGSYDNNSNSILVIYPENPNASVSIYGTSSTEHNYDTLFIYDGVGIGGTLLGVFSGENLTVPLINSTSGPLTIHFKSDISVTKAGYELFVGCVTCLMPAALQADNISNTSADLSWEGDAICYLVEYGTVGFTPGTGTSITCTTTSTTLTGLTPGTTYTVYVTAVCGDGSSSPTSLNFTTAMCPISDQCTYTFILTDSYGDGWNGGSLDVQQDGVTLATLEALHHGGGNTMSYDTVTVSLCDSVSISLVWTPGQYLSEPGFTMIGPDGTELYTISGMTNYTTYTFTTDCTIPTCLRPSAVTVSNIGSSTAEVSWTPSGLETAWNLEYKVDTATTWTVVPMTTTTYTLNNLTAYTVYDVRVQADCSNGDVSGYRATTFNTTGCDTADQCAYSIQMTGDYSDSWDFNAITVQQNGITVGTFGNFGTTSHSVTVNLCDGINTVFTFISDAYAEECGVVVTGPDGTQLYSQTDMSFATGAFLSIVTNCGGSTPVITDPTVVTASATNIAQTAATLNGTITNPDNMSITAKGFEWKVTAGSTYAPVDVTGAALTYDLTGLTANTDYTYKAFITFNGTTVYGDEVTFTTLPDDTPEPCEAPTDLHQEVTQFGELTSTVSWTDVAGASQWNVQYALENEDWTTASVNTTSFQIPNILYNTTYLVRVQAVCDENLTSDWTEAISVMVLCGIEDWLENSVTLYPNPAKEYVDIRVDGDLNVTAMEVYDVYGKVVRTVVGANDYSPLPTRVNVSGLADGMYFVRVTTEAGMVTKTFVKK